MKNKETYMDKIMLRACVRNSTFGVTINQEIFTCCGNNIDDCKKCIFSGSGEICEQLRRQWLEEEWYELPQLSKEEKTLLDMLHPRWIAMARNADNSLCLYELQDAYRLKKVDGNWDLNDNTDCYVGLLNYLLDGSYFQMVKWEDKKPWLISDLKALKVRDDV